MSNTLTLRTVLISNAWFQALWFSAALLTDQSFWLMLALLVGYGLLGRLSLIEWRQALLIALIGFSVDVGLSMLGLFSFNSLYALPFWMALLWLGLALTLHHGLYWLSALNRYLQALIGFMAGAASYTAAAALGALEFSAPTLQTALIIGAVWTLLLPSLLTLHTPRSLA